MNFFDRVNFIGRILVATYFIYDGARLFLLPDDHLSDGMMYFFYFLAFWKILGGLALAGGVKPRATAAVLAIIVLIEIGITIGVFGGGTSVVNVVMQKISTLGALLFIAGTRMIPYGLMIRSEDSMNEKYGGKK